MLLHVGTHKTGTTSLQTFLREQNSDLLSQVDAFYPPGFLLPVVHTELPLLTIRPERTWPARLRFPETRRPSWLAAAADHVRGEVVDPAHRCLIYVHEDLSYLRFEDELERLKALFASRAVTVVVFLRDRAAFLRSYRSQLEGTGFEPSTDPASFAYVEPDSWLLDYDALINAYRRCFGTRNVRVFDYDEVVRRDGTVIPAFMDILGVPRSSLPPLDTYFYNRSGAHIRLPDKQLAAIRRRLAQRYP